MDLPPWAGFLLAVAAVIGVFNVVVNHRWQRHWRKLAVERPGENFASFARNDWGQPIPPQDLREVYDWSQSSAAAGFPVRLDDDLCRDFGWCGDDLDLEVADLAERCGCLDRLAATYEQAGKPAVRTVADVVRLLARACPPEQSPTAIR